MRIIRRLIRFILKRREEYLFTDTLHSWYSGEAAKNWIVYLEEDDTEG